jgi:hypothetical protein
MFHLFLCVLATWREFSCYCFNVDEIKREMSDELS